MISSLIAAASKIMLGTTEATAMYIGSTLIWYKQQLSEELPYDCRIEYLEVNGNQHINTGVVASEYPLKLKTEVYIDNTSNEKAIWGNNYDQTDSYSSLVISSGLYNGKFFSWGGTTSWLLDGTCSANTWYEVEFGFPDANTKTMVIDGTNYSSNTSNGNAILNEGSIYLFFNGKYTDTKMSGRMKYAKLYVGGILVRDFIPVRVGLVGYMYDKITKQLFGNLGTGNFTLGPDIVEVEYLENSSNYQYIDTGISTKNSNVGIDCSINLGSYSHDKWGLGYNYYNNKDTSGFQIGCYNNNLVVGLYSSDDVIYTKIEGNPTYTNNTDYHIIINCLNVPISINGVTYGNSQLNNFGSFGGNIYLFRRNGNLNALQSAKPNTKIFYCKIYTNNNTLVRDFIPVRIGQVGYMYDKVSNKLFGNSGSGTFTLGPDINETPVEYIEGYVLNGLMFHLDGINKGTGSDWTDIINGVLFTANGCTSTQDGYLFDCSNKTYLLGPRDYITSSEDLTIEVCYYDTGSNSNYFVFGTGGSNNYPLFHKNGNDITWLLYGHLYDGSSILNNSKYTISLNNNSGLINGSVISLKSGTDYWDNNSTNIRIGCGTSGGAYNNPFNGYIYSIRIYNRRLTQAEQLLNLQVDNLRFNLGLSI